MNRLFKKSKTLNLFGPLVFLALAGVFKGQSAVAHSQAEIPYETTEERATDEQSVPNQDEAPCHEGTHTRAQPSAPGCHSVQCSSPALVTSIPQITLIPDGHTLAVSNDGLPSSPYPRRLKRPPAT